MTSPGTKGKVLIVGALGVVGRAAMDVYLEDAGWQVLGLSRRLPGDETRAGWIAADLLDRDGLDAALSHHSDITHIVYAALQEEASARRQSR